MDDLLKREIAALRHPVPVRDEWRAAVLRDVAAAPLPIRESVARAERRWSIRPIMAVAAAIAILTIGVAAGAFFARVPSAELANAVEDGRDLTTVRFVIVAPSARQVSLVGDFNGWNVAANPMRESRDGQSWILEVPLTPGRHTYAFVVDGDVLRDPTAPSVVDDDFGVRNSVIFVGDGRT
jgi:hypothetical protein